MCSSMPQAGPCPCSLHHQPAHHELDLALVLGVDIIAVLWPHQQRGILQPAAPHARAVALYDGGRQDGHHVAGEAGDAAGHADLWWGSTGVSDRLVACLRAVSGDLLLQVHCPRT